ncbi:MAG: hypothetical protein IH623_28385 [Verrucomicrobia bacterium]|nr:hypothetical protein [Verrucomicrobiota bacterium]
MEQIRRNILEKLRRRFAKMEQGNTKRFDRVLALWIDLQRAILSRKKSEDQKGGCAPWKSRQIRAGYLGQTHRSKESARAGKLVLPVAGKPTNGDGQEGTAGLQGSKRPRAGRK